MIPGEPYILWIRVPKEFTVSTARASSAGREVPVKAESDGELLTLTILGKESPVDWEIGFSNRGAGVRGH